VPIEIIEGMTQLGVAGLMGVLWVWERLLSRRRDSQLNEAHDRLMQQQEQLTVLIKLVRRNTHAIERFDQTQVQLVQALEQLRLEIRGRAA
jgi:hypothetical protein